MKNKEELAPYLSLLSRLGIGMFLCIAFGFGVGLFLDRQFQKGGIFIIAGLFLGLAMGFIYLFREIQRCMVEPDDKTSDPS